MALPNLKNNITTMLDEFDLESFKITSEVNEFAAELFGIEDILGSVQGITDFLAEFKDVVYKILDTVAELFEVFNMFSSEGITAISGGILGAVAEAMSFGGIRERADLRKIFDPLCKSYSKNVVKKFGTPNSSAQSVVVSTVLMSMMCMGIKDAYNSLKVVSYGNNSRDIVVPLARYVDDRGLPTSDTNATITNSIDIATAVATNDARLVKRNDVDKLFSNVIKPILLNGGKTADIAILEDITKSGLQSQAKTIDPNISGYGLTYLDNLGTTLRNDASVKMCALMDDLDIDYMKIDNKLDLTTVYKHPTIVEAYKNVTIVKEAEMNVDVSSAIPDMIMMRLG